MTPHAKHDEIATRHPEQQSNGAPGHVESSGPEEKGNTRHPKGTHVKRPHSRETYTALKAHTPPGRLKRAPVAGRATESPYGDVNLHANPYRTRNRPIGPRTTVQAPSPQEPPGKAIPRLQRPPGHTPASGQLPPKPQGHPPRFRHVPTKPHRDSNRVVPLNATQSPIN